MASPGHGHSLAGGKVFEMFMVPAVVMLIFCVEMSEMLMTAGNIRPGNIP